MDGGIGELRERQAQTADRWSGASHIEPGVLMSNRCSVTQLVDDPFHLRGEKQQTKPE